MDKTECYENPRGQSLGSLLDPWSGVVEETKRLTAVFEFSVTALARFLSHAQLAQQFRRAFLRSGLNVAYSQGFNPRPRMSLPLPKTVGLASQADVLCLGLDLACLRDADNPPNPESLRRMLQAQLPVGITLQSVTLVAGKVKLYPVCVTYLVSQPGADQKAVLQQRVREVMESEEWVMTRPRLSRADTEKKVDIRPYIEALTLTAQGITAACRVTSQGTIRMAELSSLLAINVDQLHGPITRQRVDWCTTVTNTGPLSCDDQKENTL